MRAAGGARSCGAGVWVQSERVIHGTVWRPSFGSGGGPCPPFANANTGSVAVGGPEAYRGMMLPPPLLEQQLDPVA